MCSKDKAFLGTRKHTVHNELTYWDLKTLKGYWFMVKTPFIFLFLSLKWELVILMLFTKYLQLSALLAHARMAHPGFHVAEQHHVTSSTQ